MALFGACLAACLLLAAASAGARQDEKPPFEFAETGALAFKHGEANEALVLNNTTRPLSLSAGLVDTNAGADKLGLSAFVEVVPNPLPVPPAGGAKLTLRLKEDQKSEPGAALTAYLVVSDGGSGRVLRRPVSFAPQRKTGGTTSPAVPSSMVGSMKATAYCWPLPGDCEVILDEPLPLDAKVSPQDLSEVFAREATLGHLNTGSGDTALVTCEGDDQELAGGTTGVRLGFKSNAPGEYTGKLPVIKTAGEKPEEIKPVTLTVVSKHHLLCAALAVLAGIVVYYLMQWYVNVLRKVSILEQQEAEMEAAFNKAEKRFKETAAGRKYVNDSIRNDFKREAAALLQEIKKLRFSSFVRLDENGPAFKSIVAKLDPLGEVVKKWGAFAAGKLNPLADALAAARPGFARRPPGIEPGVEEPAVALEAAALLAASGQKSIAEFNARAAKVDELSPRLSAWRSLNEEAAGVRERFRTIIADATSFGQLDPLKQLDIKAKENQASLAWLTLWTRSDFDPRQMRGSLADLKDYLSVLAGQNQPSAAAAVVATVPEAAAARAASPAERAERISEVRFGLDLLHFLITLTVAVYTTLATFYFEKPFGTARDYVAAFVMGFGTKPVLDTVVGALSRFTSRVA